MPDFESFSLTLLISIFVISTIIIAVVGTRMVKVSVDLAIHTGLGQAIVGAVFIGISTSLPGTILSFSTAWQNHPELSISNSIGGIAAQTLFLVFADLLTRKANLEHAAASLANIGQSVVLTILLALPLLAMVGPDITFFQIHPFSIVLVGAYIFGMRVVSQTKTTPLWQPKNTKETQKDEEESQSYPEKLKKTLSQFFILVAIMSVTGLALAEAAITLVDKTGASETAIGSFLTAVITSLPELITAIMAVRSGALNLAVGNIIGGNSFDVLFLAGSDVFYRGGSIYHQITDQHVVIITITLLMTAVLTLGMIRREKYGFAGIGFESVIVCVLYAYMAFVILT